MKILITGDSFAADYTVKYKHHVGWPNWLAQHHDVLNLAQAGCSEYKIYRQLLSVNLDNFDVIIVSHTSPYRLYVPKHPLHSDDALHKNCDIIYSDIKGKCPPLEEYFEKYFDPKYAEFIHSMIGRQIKEILFGHTSLHLQHMEQNLPNKFDHVLDLSVVWKIHSGLINHYNDTGNIKVYNLVSDKINEITN